METPKRDWEKLVEEQKGELFFVPEELVVAAKEWQDKRLVFSKEANRLAEMENDIGLDFTKLIYNLRKYFAANGIENVWTSDIGFNTDALKDGKFVINIVRAQRQV